MRLSLSRIFDLAQARNTKSGAELSEVLTFLADLGEQALRAFRNSLTIADNFDAEEKTVTLQHDVTQTISASKTVQGVLIKRVISQTTGYERLTWYYDTDNSLKVKIGFTGSPTGAIDVVLILLF